MAANPAVPDFWRYYGNKKLSDVDIILAEEEPAAPATDGEAEAEQEPAAATDGAAEAEKPEAAEDGAAVAAATPTVAGAAAAAGESETDNTAEAGTAAAPPASDGAGEQNEGGPAAATAAAAAAAAAAANRKRKRPESEHIFGHSQVLAAFSGYCRTKLEDWDEATDAADQQARSSSSGSRAAWQLRREIQLLVPAGQLELGRLLIKGLYQQQPDLSDVSQAQLIQLLLLADRFEVPKVQAAVSAAFKALPPEQLQWDTVMAVHALPAGCAELAAFQDLFSAAAAKLQHELGDLELALTEPKSSKARQLLGLPFGALKQLLQNKRTRASSENTVFYAIQQWHHQQQQQIGGSNRPQRQQAQQLESLRQQTQELLQLVRMPQCSQLFIASVGAQWDLATSCFSSSDLLFATSFSRVADAADLPAFQSNPAWLLPARPPSAMKQLIIDWKLPLAELKKAFEEHLESGEMSYLFGETRVWQGRRMRPAVYVTSKSSDGSNSRLLGVCCGAQLADGECFRASTVVRVKGAYRPVGSPDLLYTNTRNVRGRNSCVQLGAVNSWAEAEVVLLNQGLVVGDDGCLQSAEKRKTTQNQPCINPLSQITPISKDVARTPFRVHKLAHGAQDHAFLGTGGKLGLRGGGPGRHEEIARQHLAQYDLCHVHLQLPLHALCVDGQAPQLPAVCLPRQQRDRAAVPAQQMVWLVQHRGQAAGGAASSGGSSSSAGSGSSSGAGGAKQVTESLAAALATHC